MKRLLIIARSVLLGWGALAAGTYLVARPLLHWTAPLLGGSWMPTIQLTLQCIALGAAGWVAARWNQPDATASVFVFAVMLAGWNFGLVPGLDVAWLVRLTINTFGNSRYLESLITSLATHGLLFGSLFVGARLSRSLRTETLSIAGSREG
jgi:hypothetical protein